MIQNNLSNDILLSRVYPRPHEAGDPRGGYFRDSTALIHSKPFRRMKRKTQVFASPRNEHVCTRVEHVLHVATIAATICKSLQLDVDLAWAIGMGHDIGHLAFGHLGEKVIQGLWPKPFYHEIYGLRVIDHLACKGKGLNLTYAVRDGIITHCGEELNQFLVPDQRHRKLEDFVDKSHLPATWEGVVVRISDTVSYLGRDLEDALRLRMVALDMFPETAQKVLGTKNADIINTLVHDIIETAQKTGKIGFSDRVYEAYHEFWSFNYKNIYLPNNKACKNYIKTVLEILWNYLSEAFEKYQFDIEAYLRIEQPLLTRFGKYLQSMQDFYAKDDSSYFPVLDYVAGMTDDFANEFVQTCLFSGI